MMTAAIVSASICVLSRALLNIVDRKVFERSDTDFLKNVAFNAVFPLLIGIILSWGLGESLLSSLTMLTQPGVILSALGAQLASTIFSYCFGKMSVKSVIVSAKTADLFILPSLFIVTHEFKILDYCFSCLSTLIFLPILFVALATRSKINFLASIFIVAVLIFQALINAQFGMSQYADTWARFLTLMTSILIWRTIFAFIMYGFTAMDKAARTKKVHYQLLISRSLLAFVSQASFFYSITRASNNIVWPLLNLTPFVACIAASIVLQEKLEKTERLILWLLFSISTLYIIITWSPL
jgi:uncharacterized membrane protein (DUF2068 family)